MINIKDKHNCCGCEACVQACPKQCISFEEDLEGFRYPKVDETLCVKCEACENVCPVINQYSSIPPLHFYASKNENEVIRLSSSSGGLFTLLAEEIIKRGGVVFGAMFDENWDVVHGFEESIEGIAAFRTSKYVQSRIGNCFREVRDFLKKDRQVLFSGTSCQIAALRHFLHREYDNLLTVDVICHGVPSPKVWRMYLDEIMEDARKGDNYVWSPPTCPASVGDVKLYIRDISFRNKQFGWKKFCFTLTLAKTKVNGQQSIASLSRIHSDDPYMKAFLSNLNLRPSCYNCPAKGGKSGSDITLADYWGIDSQMPDFDDDKGVGLVIINSEKGNSLFDNLEIKKYEVSADKALALNSSYYKSVKPHINRKSFFCRIEKNKHCISKMMISYVQISLCTRIFHKFTKLFLNSSTRNHKE